MLQQILYPYVSEAKLYLVLPKKPTKIDIKNIIDSQIDIVKDFEGNVYWSLFNINTIGDITKGWGYQIKTNVSEEISLSITGDLTPSNFGIELPAGWSYLGYLHQEPYDACTPLKMDGTIMYE